VKSSDEESHWSLMQTNLTSERFVVVNSGHWGLRDEETRVPKLKALTEERGNLL